MVSHGVGTGGNSAHRSDMSLKPDEIAYPFRAFNESISISVVDASQRLLLPHLSLDMVFYILGVVNMISRAFSFLRLSLV
jgi:hypothetical protein